MRRRLYLADLAERPEDDEDALDRLDETEGDVDCFDEVDDAISIVDGATDDWIIWAIGRAPQFTISVAVLDSVAPWLSVGSLPRTASAVRDLVRRGLVRVAPVGPVAPGSAAPLDMLALTPEGIARAFASDDAQRSVFGEVNVGDLTGGPDGAARAHIVYAPGVGPTPSAADTAELDAPAPHNGPLSPEARRALGQLVRRPGPAARPSPHAEGDPDAMPFPDEENDVHLLTGPRPDPGPAQPLLLMGGPVSPALTARFPLAARLAERSPAVEEAARLLDAAGLSDLATEARSQVTFSPLEREVIALLERARALEASRTDGAGTADAGMIGAA